MDAFYASVGQPDAPHLRGVVIAVERSRERRLVAAASYEARRFGVQTSSNRLPIHDRPHVMVIDGHSRVGSHIPQRRDDCYLMANGPPV